MTTSLLYHSRYYRLHALLTVTLLTISIHLTSCTTGSFYEAINKIPPSSLPFQVIRRQYSLFSFCSNYYVSLGKKKFEITAKAEYTDIRGIVVIESGNSAKGYITIKSLTEGRYLCFNIKGRLCTRNKFHGNLCRFIESKDRLGTYTTLQSYFNTLWFVRFNSRGKPLLGTGKRRPRRRGRKRRHNRGRRKKRIRHRNAKHQASRCFHSNHFTKVGRPFSFDNVKSLNNNLGEDIMNNIDI